MRKKYLWLAAALMILFIFSNSAASGSASSHLSLTITEAVMKFLPQGWAVPLDTVHFVIRKLAHFSEYAALGMLITAAWKFQRCAWMPSWMPALFYSVPILDETIQRFTPGRSCELRDMLIDASGMLTGMLIMTGVLALIIRRRKQNHA